jgi:hypothetical protein
VATRFNPLNAIKRLSLRAEGVAIYWSIGLHLANGYEVSEVGTDNGLLRTLGRPHNDTIFQFVRNISYLFQFYTVLVKRTKPKRFRNKIWIKFKLHFVIISAL